MQKQVVQGMLPCDGRQNMQGKKGKARQDKATERKGRKERRKERRTK